MGDTIFVIQVGIQKLGVIRVDRNFDPQVKELFKRVLLDALDRVGEVIAPGVDLESHTFPADQVNCRHILDDVDSVPDPVGVRLLDCLNDCRRRSILAGVDGDF